MTNPLVVVNTLVADDIPIARTLWIWCPGCEAMHAPRVALPDGSKPSTEPYWEWNERTDEGFTISPSLLCHHSAHLCPPDFEHLAPCSNPDTCGSSGHALMDDGTRAHHVGHAVEPAYGNCHSFIRDGQWQFLSDCAHSLAGQTVPMVPVPDWFMS